MAEYVNRTVATSGANAAQTVSTPAPRAGVAQRLVGITVAYSAAPTFAANALFALLNSGAGAAYDCHLFQQANANTQFTFFQPTAAVLLETDDVIDVTAPAGGAGITSSVAIYTEEVG